MTDYISREAALLSMTPIVKRASERNRNILSAVKQCVDAINWCPAADVVEVVRCNDCKHRGWVQEPEHGKSVDYCRLIERCVDRQFYCAAGEIKDGDADV